MVSCILKELKKSQKFYIDEGEKAMVEKQIDEKNKKILGRVTIVLINVLAIILIITMIVIYLNRNNRYTQEQVDSTQKSNTESTLKNVSAIAYSGNISFSNMESDNEQYEDIQREILKYFDNDYFYFETIEDFHRYPQIFKGAKVCSQETYVEKVLKSTDDVCELLITTRLDGYAEEGEDN